jgi:hypothetical protein|tara:strand:+ start:9884 stop:10564 length:681 start_codon:yes stop_codon:yes gene_type:complete
MTKRIGIEINGVLRDTVVKFTELYEKHMIDKNHYESTDKTYQIEFSGDTEEILELNENTKDNKFEYKILSPVTSLDLENHFLFKDKDELYSFMYEDYTMELFGHAPSTEMMTFNLLNDIYYNLRDTHDLIIVSDEIGRSKPSSLFFLSKFGCLVEKIFFYSEITKNNMWNDIDILLTANPSLLLNKPSNKIVIKYITHFNKDIESEYSISSLSEFEDKLKKIIKNV